MFQDKLERTFDNGFMIHAWLDNDPIEGEVVKVQWRDKSGKPKHQPFYVFLDDGPECLDMLAAFVRQIRLRTQHKLSAKPVDPA